MSHGDDLRSAMQKVKVFSAASFLNDMGSEMVFSVWPLFVTKFIGADLVILGLLDGLGNMIVSMAQAAAGYLSDVLHKRKRFIVLGYTLAGISRVGYSLATAWYMVLPFHLMNRFGKIREPARDSEVAETTDQSIRGTSFGILGAFDHAGAVTGIIIAFFLFGMIGYQNLFLLAAVPSLIAATLIILFIKDRNVINGNGKFRLDIMDSNYRMFLLSSAFLALGSFSYSFILVSADRNGFGSEAIFLFYLVMSVSAVFSSLLLGESADRFGCRTALIGSTSLLAVSIFSLLFPSMFTIAVAFSAFGMYAGSIKTVQRTLSSEIAPAEYKATAFGTLQLVTAMAALPASLVVGYLWDAYDATAAFSFSLLMLVFSVITLFLVRECKEKR